MKYLLVLITSFNFIFAYSQYTDYLGAGHADNITVTSSSSQTKPNWNETASGINTINGNGLDAKVYETSRFLSQSTFGTDLEYIKNVSNQSYSDWIENQFTLPSTPYSMGDLTISIFEEARDLYYDNGGNGSYNGPRSIHYSYAWWESNMGNDDLLRQRVALALSEIFSFSDELEKDRWGEGSGYFYDVLLNNAFGNFENLLRDVTLQPMMGRYLTYFNNPKSDIANNRFPDENYAREVMQLFTIGLYKLNNDGTYILDGNGNRIPTYDNDDIAEFAKIFTGLGAGDALFGISPDFNLDFSIVDKEVPMAMYDAYHEPGEKHLLDGFIVPSGQTGMQDVEMAINHLFNHPNVGPFIAFRLIQRLVKSNPSPQYINAVANAFNNTNGIRGDMKSVIKAILLHPEARSCEWVNNSTQGKLIEPMIRYFNLMRQIPLENPSGKFWNSGQSFQDFTYQAPLSALSIFNFYYPDFSPNGPILNSGLVAPEFQIHDSFTSIGYVNIFDRFIHYQDPLFSGMNELGFSDTTFNFDELKYYAKDSEVLINYLDKLFTRGQLSNETRNTIKTALNSFVGTDDATLLTKSKIGLWLILISPDYTILK
jgi:uncharacterized protein (DUF1800 family)